LVRIPVRELLEANEAEQFIDLRLALGARDSLDLQSVSDISKDAEMAKWRIVLEAESNMAIPRRRLRDVAAAE
jgi:hypothetical protein